jgi:hypothetical protein
MSNTLETIGMITGSGATGGSSTRRTGKKADREIVDECAERLKRTADWEAKARANFEDDTRFAYADSRNGWQWPDHLIQSRARGKKPTLTINKTRVHCLQIVNDAKQNEVSVKISPIGDEATKEAAEVFEGVIRHIEYQSGAQSVYMHALSQATTGGVGYWRVATDYIDEDSFDQEIYIRKIDDPLSVYLDPDAEMADGSGARFAIIFKDVPFDVFKAEYPKAADKVGSQPLSWATEGFDDRKMVRIAEYFRRSEVDDTLLVLPSGEVTRKSKIGAELYAMLKQDHPNLRERPIVRQNIEYFKIAGDVILEESAWPGSHIPIVRCVGEQVVIDGTLDWISHARALLDPQRMYNYWTSAGVQFVALQSKVPYIGPMAAFDGLETFWDAANEDDLAWLPFNGRDNKGQPIEGPKRQEPPVMAQAFLQGMQIAAQEMEMVSGQYGAEMGAEGNERTGIAINHRKTQADTATFHFINGLANAIRATGRILVDMIPRVYDTPRVIQVLGEDGSTQSVQLDPAAAQAHQLLQQKRTGEATSIFNPGVGRYDVQADVGAAYGTRRQETADQLSQIMAHSAEAMQLGGDILFKALDFQGADELAERWQRMLPPQAVGGPTPAQLQAQQAVQEMQAKLADVMQALADEKQRRESIEQQKSIDVYKAVTDRLESLKEISPDAMRVVVSQVVQQAMSDHIKQLESAIRQGDAVPPAPPAPPPAPPSPDPQQPQEIAQ